MGIRLRKPMVCISGFWFSLLLLTLSGSIGWARESQRPQASPVDKLAQELEAVRLQGENQFFTAADGTEIVYTRFGNQSGANARPMVISPGKAESANAYIGMVKDFLERGYGPIYVIHHRGQGASPRLLPDASVVHAHAFEHYVSDFLRFVEGPVTQDLSARGVVNAPVLVAHSMGGAIADLALAEKQNLFSKVIYLAPMFEIKFPNRALSLARGAPARALVEMLCFSGCGNWSIQADTGGKSTAVSGEAIRRAYAERLDAEAGQAMNDAVTLRWLREAMRASARIRARAQSTGSNTLIIQASRDRLVRNEALYEYACRSETCTLAEVRSTHAIPQVDGENRSILVERMDEFFRTGRIAGEVEQKCLNFFRLVKQAKN